MEIQNIDWSPIFTGASLLLAVASPIITATINSHVQKRERKAMFLLQHKADVIENYAGAACRMLHWDNEETRVEYSKCYGQILILAPEYVRQDIIALDNLLYNEYKTEQDVRDAKNLLNRICSELSQHSPRVKAKKRNKIAK